MDSIAAIMIIEKAEAKIVAETDRALKTASRIEILQRRILTSVEAIPVASQPATPSTLPLAPAGDPASKQSSVGGLFDHFDSKGN